MRSWHISATLTHPPTRACFFTFDSSVRHLTDNSYKKCDSLTYAHKWRVCSWLQTWYRCIHFLQKKAFRLNTKCMKYEMWNMWLWIFVVLSTFTWYFFGNESISHMLVMIDLKIWNLGISSLCTMGYMWVCLFAFFFIIWKSTCDRCVVCEMGGDQLSKLSENESKISKIKKWGCLRANYYLNWADRLWSNNWSWLALWGKKCWILFFFYNSQGITFRIHTLITISM